MIRSLKIPTKQSLLRLLGAGLLSAGILVSCSGGRIGYGVVLWSPDKSTFKTGQIVTVQSQSTINNTYALKISGAKSAVDVPTWRIKLFSTEKQAINYSLAYSPMVSLFAKATVNGAPIRDRPAPSAARIYRLRHNEVIKIISKQPKPVTIDAINGYWYKVLTSDGVLGYTFDANLHLYNPSVQSRRQKSAAQLLLNKILATTYRPRYFQQMIDNHRIDLKRFSPQFGLFVNPTAKTIRIVMPKHKLTFEYRGIKDAGPNDYTFSGTSLEMIIQNPDEIRLLYSDNKGNQYDQSFVNIKQDIGLLVEKERNRRLQVYTSFLDKTPFSSDYYGTIDLGPNMGFRWTGYSRLVPDIIPSGAGATGLIDFPIYLSDTLLGSYDGVITFIFGAKPAEGSSSGRSGTTGPTPKESHPTVSFLYSFADGGVKLTYVPPGTIDNDTVTRISSTPIIIFFSFK